MGTSASLDTESKCCCSLEHTTVLIKPNKENMILHGQLYSTVAILHLCCNIKGLSILTKKAVMLL